MSTTVREAIFTHRNDCCQTGCTGHTMRITYYNTSDTVSMTIDGDEYVVLDDRAREALIHLAQEKK